MKVLASTAIYVLCFTIIFGQGNAHFLEVADGLTNPTVITNAGDGTNRLFIAEQSGVIKLIKNTATMVVEPVPFLDIRNIVDDSANEEGLLGLVFHPNFENNGYFYVNYIKNDSPRDSTRISRFSINPFNPDTALPSSEVIILNYAQTFNNHNGGDLQFGPDGMLYIAAGDGGSSGDPGNNGQNPNSLLGSILRIDVDNPVSGMHYSVPANNPFGNEVWLYGLRNPWRFSFDRLTNDMYVADVGQNAREEVSVVGAGVGGLNLGWRCWEGFSSFNQTGCSGPFHQPIIDYPHNSATGGFSITGGYVYRGSTFSNFTGWYFFIDFVTERLWQTQGTSQAGLQVTTKVINNVSSVSSFGESESGELYAVSLGRGDVYRLIDLDDCPITLNIPIIDELQNVAQQEITSDAVIVQDNVVYGAPEVVLNPTFEVNGNLNFETLLGICGSN